MADGSDTTLTTEQPLAGPGGLVAGIRSFAADHGGAKAVIEYVGRRGARIVLVGEDGAWADQFADGTDVAREACAKAGVRRERVGAGADRAHAPEQRPVAVDGPAHAGPLGDAHRRRSMHNAPTSATRARRPGRSRYLRRAARPRPRRPARCSRRSPRRGVDRRAGRLGRPGRRLGRLRPGRAPLALGLRAAPRRVRRLGARRAAPGQPGRRGRLEHRQALPRRARRRRRPGRPDDRGSAPGDDAGPPPAPRRVRRSSPRSAPAASDTGRYDLADPRDRASPARTSRRLPAAGRLGHGPAVPAGGRHLRRDRAAVPRPARTGWRSATPSARARCSPAPTSASTGSTRPEEITARDADRRPSWRSAERVLAALPGAPSGCSTPGST